LNKSGGKDALKKERKGILGTKRNAVSGWKKKAAQKEESFDEQTLGRTRFGWEGRFNQRDCTRQPNENFMKKLKEGRSTEFKN